MNENRPAMSFGDRLRVFKEAGLSAARAPDSAALNAVRRHVAQLRQSTPAASVCMSTELRPQLQPLPMDAYDDDICRSAGRCRKFEAHKLKRSISDLFVDRMLFAHTGLRCQKFTPDHQSPVSWTARSLQVWLTG